MVMAYITTTKRKVKEWRNLLGRPRTSHLHYKARLSIESKAVHNRQHQGQKKKKNFEQLDLFPPPAMTYTATAIRKKGGGASHGLGCTPLLKI